MIVRKSNDIFASNQQLTFSIRQSRLFITIIDNTDVDKCAI